MSELATKFCKTCQTEKPRSEFYRDYQRKDKLNTKCKVCLKIYLSAPHRVERQGELVQSYRLKPEWITRKREYQRRWYQKKRMEEQWQKNQNAVD